jgi:hypothetical protein
MSTGLAMACTSRGADLLAITGGSEDAQAPRDATIPIAGKAAHSPLSNTIHLCATIDNNGRAPMPVP